MLQKRQTSNHIYAVIEYSQSRHGDALLVRIRCKKFAQGTPTLHPCVISLYQAFQPLPLDIISDLSSRFPAAGSISQEKQPYKKYARRRGSGSISALPPGSKVQTFSQFPVHKTPPVWTAGNPITGGHIKSVIQCPKAFPPIGYRERLYNVNVAFKFG